MTLITEPGIYPGVLESVYHADASLAPDLGRSLSSSGAKTLLESPARFAWEREHGRTNKPEYDLGSLAHTLILGNADDRIVKVDADDWKTKASRDARDAAYAERKVPVTRTQQKAAEEFAAAVQQHPSAGPLFQGGVAEESLYWIDPATGVTCRGRTDYRIDSLVVDLKTSAIRPTPDAFARVAANYRYHLQAAWYLRGLRALTGIDHAWVWVVVHTLPPYEIGLYYLTPHTLAAGERLADDACALYAEYESNNSWPSALSPDILPLELPIWAA